MVREYGPFRERFEEYILERTGDHPSVIPVVMDGQGKASFRLVCKETLNHSNFSSWLDQASLDGPEKVLIDEEISACLKELGYSGELADEALPDRADPGFTEEEALSPGFEELIQIVRAAAAATPLNFMRLVLASSQGEVRFLEVTEGPEFRRELETAFREDFQALGMLANSCSLSGVQQYFPNCRVNQCSITSF